MATFLTEALDLTRRLVLTAACCAVVLGPGGIAYLTDPAAAFEKGEDTTGRVERVIDGDTLVVEGRSLRLIGLDAPESAQPLGPESTDYLRQLVLGETVAIHVHRIDQYGRPLVSLQLDGEDVGARIVRAGWAWNGWPYTPRTVYVTQEREAVCAKRGLWSGGVTPPWQWRDCR